MGQYPTATEIKGDFGRNRKFIPLRVCNTPANGAPLEFYNGGGAQKTRVMAPSESERV